MHIAIDDTYGSNVPTGSKYVTENRKTHVAVCFKDDDVGDIRKEVRNFLSEINVKFKLSATEFHFVEVLNKKNEWKKLPADERLGIFEFFAKMYERYRWPIHVQTIDDRTLSDHGMTIGGKIGTELDLSKRADLSLLFLLIKIKLEYKAAAPPITLFLDEGRRPPGTAFGKCVFPDWPAPYKGQYASSRAEPLLQLADFFAYCINRSTYLATKNDRSVSDDQLLALVTGMEMSSPDLKRFSLPVGFKVDSFDAAHAEDRREKGLP